MLNTPITFLQCNLGRASHSSIEISSAIPLHNASILALQEPYNLNNSPVGFPLKFSVAAPNINPLVCTFFAPDISCTLVRKFSDQYFCVCELIWPFCQPLYLINCYLPPSLPLTPLLDKLHTIICLLPDSNILNSRRAAVWFHPSPIITQFLTGHCNVRAYLTRFNLRDDDLCDCGIPQTAEHELVCPDLDSIKPASFVPDPYSMVSSDSAFQDTVTFLSMRNSLRKST